MAKIVSDIIEIIEEAEKLKGFWDDTGLDMHIAVKKDHRIAISTKHWVRVHYITTNQSTDEMWKSVGKISKNIGRTLIKSPNGPYVYINKLSEIQTEQIFEKFKEYFGVKNVVRVWEIHWEIDDAVLPTQF